jgi:hypothetical protein
MKQMKFAIIILVAVVISILLGLALSCFLAESESITTEQHIINTSVPVTTANTVEETTDELFDPVKYYDWYWYTNNYSISDVENPAFETIGEYYAFMDHFDQVLPQDMITYSCLEEIGDFAFWGCINLKKVKLPKTVKRIGYQAFSPCTEVKNIPENVSR